MSAVLSPAPEQSLDDENEAHIASLNQLILECYAAYTAFGCEEDRAEAQHYAWMRNEAVKARSAYQVARMEQDRGLTSA